MYYLNLCCTNMYTLNINNIKNNLKNMRILAIDVGTGTQDMMIYDTEKELENSIKLVLPSPHLYISQQIRDLIISMAATTLTIWHPSTTLQKKMANLKSFTVLKSFVTKTARKTKDS